MGHAGALSHPTIYEIFEDFNLLSERPKPGEFEVQARRDLNPQPANLESAALPIEPRAYKQGLL